MHEDREHRTGEHCPECGAPRIDGMNCWEQLGAILALEWQDPELQAEHFMTVASYNLQHPAQFTEQAITGLAQQFREYLNKGLPVTEIRRRVAQSAEGKTKVLKPETERRPVLKLWSMTIADVYLPNQPQGAAARVKAWAATIRKELEHELLPNSSSAHA